MGSRTTPDWLRSLRERVRIASRAFPTEDDWPDAWLYLGNCGDNEKWYDWDQPLLGRPVYHSPAWLQHCGYDGQHQEIVPLWSGDVFGRESAIREFQCRLAESGDF